MPVGDSLATSFNQDDAEKQRSTHAKHDDQAAAFKRKTTVDMDRIQHTKVGNEVAYTKGQGTIVSKDGAYVTIFNQEANAYDQVHAGETYIPGDTISMGIMNQLWDQMAIETRTSLLHKAKIEQPQFYVNKTWHDMPENLKEVLKKSPPYTSVGSGWVSPPKGAHQDKKPGKPRGAPKLGTEVDAGAAQATGQTKRTKPDRVFRDDVKNPGKKVSITEGQGKRYDRQYPKHLQDDPSFVPGQTTVGGKPVGNSNTEKSDVEHSHLGGVVTDTPFDAEGDYEGCNRNGERAQMRHENVKEPKNYKEHEILSGKTDEEVSKEGGGAVTTGSAGVNNAVYGDKEREVKNKYNTRSGPRQVTKAEAERFLNK